MTTTKPEKLSPKDFASDQEVRWCPGCGDYAILKALQKTLAELGAEPHRTVFVSGIGCSSRFPYYMSTYGFHTIHGRAPAVATGLKLANPDLDVWVITGDGDGLSIGGNHLLHVLRRNVNLQIILFNNEIYGLTKGQYSPTSRIGTRSPSTPLGSVDNPVLPCSFAIGAGARFIARAIDTSQKEQVEILKRAHAPPGAAFVEIFQNCVVYNDNVFADFTDRKTSSDTQLYAEHGKPLLFGKDNDRGLRLKQRSMEIEVVTLGNGVTQEDILVHDQKNRTLAALLCSLQPPAFPMVLGVLYDDPAPTYEDAVFHQVANAADALPTTDLDSVLRRGRTWTVAG